MEPKFKPGDFVLAKGNLLAGELGKSYEKRLVVYQVLESHVGTCPGGTQIVYHCRGHVPGGSDHECCSFNEVELQPLTPDVLEAMKKAAKRPHLDEDVEK